MLKKPIWSAIETTLFYYSGDMYNWSSLFEAIEVKERSRMNFNTLTSRKKFLKLIMSAHLRNVRRPSVGQAITKVWIVTSQFFSS